MWPHDHMQARLEVILKPLPANECKWHHLHLPIITEAKFWWSKLRTMGQIHPQFFDGISCKFCNDASLPFSTHMGYGSHFATTKMRGLGKQKTWQKPDFISPWIPKGPTHYGCQASKCCYSWSHSPDRSATPVPPSYKPPPSIPHSMVPKYYTVYVFLKKQIPYTKPWFLSVSY